MKSLAYIRVAIPGKPDRMQIEYELDLLETEKSDLIHDQIRTNTGIRLENMTK